MQSFTTLGDAARVVHAKPMGNGHHQASGGDSGSNNRHRNSRGLRQRQIAPWHEFEPILNQIRISAGNASSSEMLKAMGYSASSSLLAEWRKIGVPVVAVFAARGLLASMGVQPPQQIRRQFESDEIITLLSAVSRLPASDAERGTIIKRLAREI